MASNLWQQICALVSEHGERKLYKFLAFESGRPKSFSEKIFTQDAILHGDKSTAVFQCFHRLEITITGSNLNLLTQKFTLVLLTNISQISIRFFHSVKVKRALK